MPSLKILPTLVIIFLTSALAQNTTSSADNGEMKQGWQDGPDERGSLTILWSCLSTIIACTWTILHLNVPGSCDKMWKRILRKAKWMLVTILFPEFLFSKAVCELQMAVDDLHAMKQKKALLGDNLEWDVAYGRRLQFLYWIFHLFSRTPEARNKEKQEPLPQNRAAKLASTSRERADKETASECSGPKEASLDVRPPKQRTWTITHSYFANMGGFQRHHLCGATCRHVGSCEEAESNPVTAYALVNCCVGSPHCPLADLNLSCEDIEDKSKADWFLKSIAVVQISWLLLSVIDRAATHLPITQLEICASAFALLAIATYLANWSKPKDVGRPQQLKSITDISQCEAWKYYGEPFVRRLYRPSESGKANEDYEAGGSGNREQGCYRIENDFVRLDGFLPPMTITMAISTAIFGGLHCLAWNFAFPTWTEMMVWMVASVLSATIPLVTLLANMLLVGKIHRALSRFAKETEDEIKSFYITELGAENPETSIPRSPVVLSNLDGSQSPATEIYSFYYNLTNFLSWKIRHRLVFESFDTAFTATFPVISSVVLKEKLRRDLLALSLTEFEISFLFQVLQNRDAMKKRQGSLYGVIRPCNRVAGFVTIVGGVLYASVRLILLSLAFCALRYVPQGVYTATWTRFLPNVS